MRRRHFVALAGGSIGWATAAAAAPPLVIRAWLPNGQPLGSQRFGQLFFLDLQGEPWPQPHLQVEAGTLVCQPPPAWPVAIALQLPVAGFGDVWLYADGQGQGLQPHDFPLLLNRQLAWDRLHRVSRALTQWQRRYSFSPAIQARLDRAAAALEQAESAAAPIHLWNQALGEALWAGEELVLARARQRIQGRPPRQQVRFGANFFGYPRLGAAYNQRFRQAFDLATVPLYWRTLEPQQGQPQLRPLEAKIGWLQRMGIAPKGHPLVWLNTMGGPYWRRNYPYLRHNAEIYHLVGESTRRYGNASVSVDVINEAHGVPWANDLGFSADQFLELTALACSAARQGHPQLTRIINCCCLWGKSVAYNGPGHRSPYRYLQSCLQAGIDFEVIGLQLYYPDHDLFEIDRCLDRFASLGKPIHITEMATSSQPTEGNSSMQIAAGSWRGPWSEALQADWLEAIYTLAYSKPAVEAISWWDLCDRDTFWPFGGLLDAHCQPKLAFQRLLSLQTAWGIGAAKAEKIAKNRP